MLLIVWICAYMCRYVHLYMYFVHNVHVPYVLGTWLTVLYIISDRFLSDHLCKTFPLL